MNTSVFQVNFLIVGAQKAGTTALSSFLSQHPEISFARDKEAHLFDSPSFKDSWTRETVNEEYRKYFSDIKDRKIIGEGTPIYMYLPFIARRIFAYNPDMKLIFLLRSPVERAISQYYMEKARGYEGLPLNAAIMLEKFRLWLHRNDFSERSSVRAHSYVDRGIYAKQIRNMLKYFPMRQMLFIRSEDLLNDHKATLTNIYNFLNIKDKLFIPPAQIVFASEKSIKVDEKIVRKLANILNSDMIELEHLLGWDLSDWKDSEKVIKKINGAKG